MSCEDEDEPTVRYRIVEAETAKELQAKVNTLLSRGWELQGGVCVASPGNNFVWWYFQAMIRRP